MSLDNIKCAGCGTNLQFKPGTNGLTCTYCNHEMQFSSQPSANEAFTELNVDEYINSISSVSQQIERQVIACKECGASTELAANQQSGSCPFCETPFVISQSQSQSSIKPQALLPFKIEKTQASTNFKKWLDTLWFAPSELKKQATQFEKLRGIYLPFWTYDCSTFTYYSGQRGEHYNETVSERDQSGNVTTREVQKTRWHYASGSFDHNFDDILISATQSLPENELDSLAPWDLESLVDYKEDYLRGYITESYKVDLKTGYGHAKKVIDKRLEKIVKQKIGGDEQQIASVNTYYSSATFKHILLPVWVSAYRFQNKLYQVIVNARTGAVQGERPWSVLKIAMLLGSIIAAVGLGIFLLNFHQAR